MQDIINIARGLADSGDIYEMGECPSTFETCGNAGCIHVILMDTARGMARNPGLITPSHPDHTAWEAWYERAKQQVGA